MVKGWLPEPKEEGTVEQESKKGVRKEPRECKKNENKRKCFFCRKQMHYIRESEEKKKKESQ